MAPPSDCPEPFPTALQQIIYSPDLPIDDTRQEDTMGNIMGKDKPLKEVLRENKRMINRAVRELDREKTGLEREEKRMIMEIKKAAKENQMAAVKIMAKDLVRTRQHITKFIEMRR